MPRSRVLGLGMGENRSVPKTHVLGTAHIEAFPGDASWERANIGAFPGHTSWERAKLQPPQDTPKERAKLKPSQDTRPGNWPEWSAPRTHVLGMGDIEAFPGHVSWEQTNMSHVLGRGRIEAFPRHVSRERTENLSVPRTRVLGKPRGLFL